MSTIGIIAIVVVVVLLLIALTSVKVVQQSTARVVERLGKFNRIINSGVHFIIPIFERTREVISLKEKVADFYAYFRRGFFLRCDVLFLYR